MARKLKFDKLLFSTVMVLLGIGLVMVFSTSALGDPASAGDPYRPFLKQAVAAALGLALMSLAMHVDYRKLKQPWLLYALLLLALTLLVLVLFSPMVNNSRRWLHLAGLTFQPSELAKVSLVLFLAYQIDRKAERVNHPTFLVPVTVAVLMISALVLLEPDFGTAGLILMVAGSLLFLGGVAWRYIVAAAVLAVPALWLLVLSEPYRLARLFAYLRPEDDPLGKGFQALQSLIAVGSGGLFGLGLGQSVQKLHFLPLASSDFIYAIVAEELGLLGALAVLSLFALLAWRGVRAGWLAPDGFGRYLAWGLTAVIVLQALVNISITLNLLPITGAPLPLISHGGSSLVVTLGACGLLLNVSQHA